MAASENAITMTTTAYASVGPEKPYSIPPAAGPATAARCHDDVRQATEFACSSRGTTEADNAKTAGRMKLRAVALSATTTYTGQMRCASIAPGIAVSTSSAIADTTSANVPAMAS